MGDILVFLLWAPSKSHPISLPSFPPLLPFQIIKAYLDYSLYQHLAGYQDVWFKYEVMAMKQIFNLPLKREGVEIMTYVADRLGYIKLLMGHLDLAIDLGKGWLVKKGPANAITRTILELFCSQVLEPTRCGHCFGIPINTIWSSAGFVNASS